MTKGRINNMRINEIKEIVKEDHEGGTTLYIGRSVEEGENIVVNMNALGSGAIIGGSGSGKSWYLYNILMNLIYFNKSDEIDIRIVDLKDSPMNEAFQSHEHVTSFVGGSVERFKHELEELYKEMLNRESKIEEGTLEQDTKSIYFIFEEATATLSDLEKELKEEEYKDLLRKIRYIVKRGRKTGIKMIIVAQRPLDIHGLEGVMENITWVYITKLELESDWNKVFGEEVKNIDKKIELGKGYFKTFKGGKEQVKGIQSYIFGIDEEYINNRDILETIREER